LKLTRAARAQLLKLIASAAPLDGTFFRSVAFRYFHPDDLISGEGTWQYGGRFVPVGVRAVYASAEEETALREVTQRKTTLGGERQIDVGEYPRMIYLLTISTQRNLDLTRSIEPQLEQVVPRCLVGRTHTVSQELAVIWIKEGIESVVFPSATGTGKNVVVYLENARGSRVMVRNRDEILNAFRRTTARPKFARS
jgi:RES domain-containing protein